MRYEPKTIYCPKCCHKVATWDRKSSMNIEVKCNKCNKLVVFRPINQTVNLMELPERVVASGKRFY